MFEIGVVTTFEAAHRLEGNFGPATRMHGHTYRLAATLRGKELQDDGTLCDITRLQEVLTQITDDLHYRVLDDVEGLAGQNTTAERVADYCRRRISAAVRGLPVGSLRVEVWENSSAFAAWDGPIEHGE